ncbi:MAG: hypothetical protein LBD63_02310, partial [Mycoplasmataceae bacterium]|nr:hypothetical protein [Mycoplasmataceae bacterium]
MFKHNKLLKRIGLFSVIGVTGSLSTLLILNNVTYSNSIITTQSSRTTTTGMQAVGENDDPYPSAITGNNVLDMSSEKSGTATFDWYAIDPYSNIINLSTWGNF